MAFLTEDELNREIWTQSQVLQRQICAANGESTAGVGAQQAMPKPEQEHLFSGGHPLPWVPDRSD